MNNLELTYIFLFVFPFESTRYLSALLVLPSHFSILSGRSVDTSIDNVREHDSMLRPWNKMK